MAADNREKSVIIRVNPWLIFIAKLFADYLKIKNFPRVHDAGWIEEVFHLTHRADRAFTMLMNHVLLFADANAVFAGAVAKWNCWPSICCYSDHPSIR